MTSSTMIGKEISHDRTPTALLSGEPQQLTQRELDFLWRIFVEIGRCWGNMEHDSADVKSSWLEFVAAKTAIPPSYVGEYSNAVSVVSELIEIYGEDQVFPLLFLNNGIPEGPPTTRLAHVKTYVIDEFIRVQIVAGGFKSFGGRNYGGYVGGSRYNRVAPVRIAKES